MKTIVIGLDGACFEWIMKYLKKRKNKSSSAFTKIINQGSIGFLHSTLPPTTPPAWTTILTGVNPRKHRIFNFFDVRSGRALTMYHSVYPLLWEILEKYKVKNAFLWVPMTYPALKYKYSFIFAGFPYPEAIKLHNLISYSSTFAKLAKNMIYKYRKQILGILEEAIYPDVNKFLTSICYRFTIIKWLASAPATDFVFAVIPETDHIWHYSNNERLGLRLYEKVDQQLCDLLKFLNEITHNNYRLFIISDHGTSHLAYKGVFPNNILLEKGFLEVRKEKEQEKLLRLITNKIFFSHFGKKILSVLNMVIPFGLALKTYLRHRESSTNIDFKKSKALFIHGPTSRFGKIIIKDSEIVNSVMSILYNLRDNHKKVIKRILQINDIYSGENLDNEFSYIVEFIPGYAVFDSITPLEPISRILKYYTHSKYGVFMAYGKGIKREQLGVVDIGQMLPTLLTSMRLPVPHYVEKKPILAVFEKGSHYSIDMQISPIKIHLQRRIKLLKKLRELDSTKNL